MGIIPKIFGYYTQNIWVINVYMCIKTWLRLIVIHLYCTNVPVCVRRELPMPKPVEPVEGALWGFGDFSKPNELWAVVRCTMPDPHNYFPGTYECGEIDKGVWLGGKVDAVMYDSMPSEGMVLEIIERTDDFSPRSVRREDRWLTHFQSFNDYTEGTRNGVYLFCLFFLDNERKTCWHRPAPAG